MDCLSFLFSALGLVIAAGGGIGGGGILVPVFMVFLRFRPKHAVALSNFTILGGSVATTAFNMQSPDPSGGSPIDWDVVVMMEPSTIAGAIVGSFVAKCLPDVVLSVLLLAVLAMLAYRTLEKGVKMFQRESEEGGAGAPVAPRELLDGDRSDDEASESQTLIGGKADADLDPERVDRPTPWSKIALLTICFGGCAAIVVLKGGGHGSVIGVECGSTSFWFLVLSAVPWVVGFVAVFRHMLLGAGDAAPAGRSGARARWDAATTVRYPALCTVAGLLGGLFSVGGGIVMGPLMLEMGVAPAVAAGTAAAMILATTCAACISLHVFGLVEPGYGAACFLLGLACTACGQGRVNAWMKAARRQSPPVLSVGLVMALSTTLVAWEAFEKFTHEDAAALFKLSSVCSQVD
eukprot:CAMPEP_0179219586 /NCGR_PEP_ID=MMETSP0797-20121207/5117_1 /TAXON_ID=47934 /ORGANISM="Dinophysis acuminata, Strain DAEP01" /LENGTH=405 /DNA_ID=CAMNT_0020926073 /DNA_START=17 /DNA_END=1234 /DNA_ORIENTATION=-